MSERPDTATSAGHDLSVPYSEEVMPGAAIVPTEWDAWSYAGDAGVDVYVKGPCPACRATTQGHVLDSEQGPFEPQGSSPTPSTENRTTAPRSVEVSVRCTCGYGHGNNEAKSCGRSWVVELAQDAT